MLRASFPQPLKRGKAALKRRRLSAPCLFCLCPAKNLSKRLYNQDLVRNFIAHCEYGIKENRID